jgi:hypothetical protein
MFPGIRSLAVAAIIATTPQLQAQLREPPRPEVRGVIKAIDAGAGTITVTTGDGREPAAEKPFILAKDVEVGAASPGRTVVRAAKAGDLSAGLTVSLSLAGDQQTVETIIAEGPLVRGLLKQVDAARQTLTIEVQSSRESGAEENSYTLAGDVEVGLDDGRGSRFSLKEGKANDLMAGAIVTARLSLDRKHVQSIVAEGPILFGTVKSLDPDKKTLVLLARPIARPPRSDEAGEQRSLSVAANAVVLLDDGRGRRLSLKEGTLADVPAGSNVSARLSADQSTVTLLRAEGPSVIGMLKSVDAAKPAITIAIPRARGEAPEEKTFAIAESARITLDNNEAKLADLKPADNGPFVQLRLSLDQTQVQSIFARNPAR